MRTVSREIERGTSPKIARNFPEPCANQRHQNGGEKAVGKPVVQIPSGSKPGDNIEVGRIRDQDECTKLRKKLTPMANQLQPRSPGPGEKGPESGESVRDR